MRWRGPIISHDDDDDLAIYLSECHRVWSLGVETAAELIPTALAGYEEVTLCLPTSLHYRTVVNAFVSGVGKHILILYINGNSTVCKGVANEGLEMLCTALTKEPSLCSSTSNGFRLTRHSPTTIGSASSLR